MSKYTVITFPSEEKAYEGVRGLRDLHNEGRLSLHAVAVLARDADGQLVVRDEQDDGPVGFAVGSLVGAMIGVFGGPAGLAAGMAGGAMIGSMSDLNDAGVGTEFLTDVAAQMEEAQAAVVAEISEEWVTPLDARMEALDGVVLRQYRVDVEDAQLDREIEAWNRELDELDAEMAEASDEAKANLKAKRERVRAKLRKAHDRAKSRAESVQQEASAKMVVMKSQAAEAKADFRTGLQKRMQKLDADHKAFSDKLKQAWERTKEKLS